MNPSLDKAKLPHPQEPSNESNNLRDVCCGRPSAKSLLDNLLYRKQKEQNDLRVLFGMLPTELTAQQDEALFNILNNLK